MPSKGLSAATLVALVVTGVEGHGWMTLPRSRTEVACENREEYSPHGSLWDVEEGLAHIDGRGSPGRNPFSEPGLGVAAYGPCGKGRRGGGNDYNRPQMSWAGSNNTGRLVDTFAAGEIVKVEWMVKANHRGLYSYRLCANQTLVDPFLNGARAPGRAEYDALEACFQDGILPCNAPGLANHACASSEIEPDCQPEWGCNNPEWFHMVPQQQNSDYLFVDYVKLPGNFVSDHTLMSFRWDSKTTHQLYLDCADIAITTDGVPPFQEDPLVGTCPAIGANYIVSPPSGGSPPPQPSGPPTPAPPTNPPTTPPPTNPPTLAPPTNPPTPPPPPCAADWQVCSAGQECCNANFDCKIYQGTVSCSP